MIYRSKQLQKKDVIKNRSRSKIITQNQLGKNSQSLSDSNIINKPVIQKNKFINNYQLIFQNQRAKEVKIQKIKSQSKITYQQNPQFHLFERELKNQLNVFQNIKNPYFDEKIKEIDNNFHFQNSNQGILSKKNDFQSYQNINQENQNQTEILTPFKQIQKYNQLRFQLQRIKKLLQKKNLQIQRLTSQIFNLKDQLKQNKVLTLNFSCWKQILFQKLKRQNQILTTKLYKQKQQLPFIFKQKTEQQKDEQIFMKKMIRQSFLKGIHRMNTQALSIIEDLEKDVQSYGRSYKNGLYRSKSIQDFKDIKVRYFKNMLPTLGNKEISFNPKNIQQIVLTLKDQQKQVIIPSSYKQYINEKRSLKEKQNIIKQFRCLKCSIKHQEN